jgi:2-dehydro-3-deoxyphosphooctonate aldolase (KDO 8-P synthase)
MSLPCPDRLLLIAGPCVIESLEQCLKIGTQVAQLCRELRVDYVFKASFDKANRSSGASFRGPGLEDGLVVLDRVRREIGVPVLTDVHEPSQATPAGQVVDVLQVPAFLSRQTDLLVACARTGKTVNVKKGQFMSPQEMGLAVEKVRQAGGGDLWLTERGTFFGYNRLVNDFTGLATMAGLGVPVIFDASHSTQQPGAQGSSSGGTPEMTPLLARAAVATGVVSGLFIECHPDPPSARSDAATMLPLDAVGPLLRACVRIFEASRQA